MEEKHTPLYHIHRELDARMVPFAGWMMPLQYTGVIDEHLTVRNSVGLFDVSHMGEIEVSGPGAQKAVENLTSNLASTLYPKRVQYTLICNDHGGVVDDVTLYRLADDRFLFCANACNTDKDYRWIRERAEKVEVVNRSPSFAQFAIQGPLSERLLQRFCKEDLSQLKYYHFMVCDLLDIPSIVSKTGYTGEDGFEIYIPPEVSQRLWKELLKKGKEYGIKPCGLGARDTLRLEMCYPLYGHELSEDLSPFEAGLERFVKLDKGPFIGRTALKGVMKEGVKRRLVGLKMVDKGIPRANYKIFAEKEEIGYVTSGTMSPSLGIAIGMGLVEPTFSNIDQEISVEIRGKMVKARVVKRPFYTKKKNR